MLHQIKSPFPVVPWNILLGNYACWDISRSFLERVSGVGLAQHPPTSVSFLQKGWAGSSPLFFLQDPLAFLKHGTSQARDGFLLLPKRGKKHLYRERKVGGILAQAPLHLVTPFLTSFKMFCENRRGQRDFCPAKLLISYWRSDWLCRFFKTLLRQLPP